MSSNLEFPRLISKLSWIFPIFGVISNIIVMSLLPGGTISDIIRVSLLGIGLIGGLVCGIIVLIRKKYNASDKKHATISVSLSASIIILSTLAVTIIFMKTKENPYSDIIDEVRQVNKSCPIKMSDDEMFQSMAFENGMILITIQMQNFSKEEIMAAQDKIVSLYTKNGELMKAKYLARGCKMEYLLIDKIQSPVFKITLSLVDESVTSIVTLQ